MRNTTAIATQSVTPGPPREPVYPQCVRIPSCHSIFSECYTAEANPPKISTRPPGGHRNLNSLCGIRIRLYPPPIPHPPIRVHPVVTVYIPKSRENRDHMRDGNVISWYSRLSHQSNTLVAGPSVGGIADLSSPFILRAIYCFSCGRPPVD